MSTRFPQIWLYALSALASIALAQESSFKTTADVEQFMQNYYRQPQPELIEVLIEALQPTGFVQKATAAPPIIGFFSEIFAANPNRLSQWQVLIAKQDEQTKLRSIGPCQ